MRFRRVGNSGLVVSVIGLGCNAFGWRIDEAASMRVVESALDAGITFFDTANVYGSGDSERYLGAALGSRRHDVIVATKFGGRIEDGPYGRGASRRHIRRAVEDSLERLGTDWIDLYQVHFPDVGTPIDETLATLSDLVREGKVRYVGNSNFAAWQIADADWTGSSNHISRFISAQNEYSLVNRAVEAEVAPACERFGLGLLAYLPLAGGLLTGGYGRGEPPPHGSRLQWSDGQVFLTERNFAIVEQLEAFASDRQTDLLSVAIGGIAAQPAVASVIVGASKAKQLAANVAASEWIPTVDDLAALDAISPSPRPQPS